MRYFATEGTEVDLFGFLFLEGEQSHWVPAVLAAVRGRAGPCCTLTVCVTAAVKPTLAFAVILLKRQASLRRLNGCFPWPLPRTEC